MGNGRKLNSILPGLGVEMKPRFPWVEGEAVSVQLFPSAFPPLLLPGIIPRRDRTLCIPVFIGKDGFLGFLRLCNCRVGGEELLGYN